MPGGEGGGRQPCWHAPTVQACCGYCIVRRATDILYAADEARLIDSSAQAHMVAYVVFGVLSSAWLK